MTDSPSTDTDSTLNAVGFARSRALLRFSMRLFDVATVDQLSKVFETGFGSLIEVPMYGFVLIDPNTGEVGSMAAANVSPAFLARYDEAGREVDVVRERAATTGHPAYNLEMMSSEEWLESAVYRSAYYMHDVRQVVEVPMLGSSGPIGYMKCGSSSPDCEIDADDVRDLEMIGRLMASALERVRARESREREREQAMAALELSGAAVVVSSHRATEPARNGAASQLLAGIGKADECLNRLVAYPVEGESFSRRSEIELTDGTRGVLRGDSIWVGKPAVLVTVLTLEADVPQIEPRLLRPLTPREREVAALVSDGMTDREIAERLHLSHHTVRQYVKSVYRKLGVDSRVALTRLLLGLGRPEVTAPASSPN